MSDEDLRRLERTARENLQDHRALLAFARAYLRVNPPRFVALLEVSSASDPPVRGGVPVTRATRCGPRGRNLLRHYCWAVPLRTLEDLAELEKTAAVSWVYDLERRRTLSGSTMDSKLDPSQYSAGEEWPSTEVEEGWVSTEFKKDCTPADLGKLLRSSSF